MTDWQSWSRSPVRRERAHLEAASTCIAACTSGEARVSAIPSSRGVARRGRYSHIPVPMDSTRQRVAHCYKMVTNARKSVTLIALTPSWWQDALIKPVQLLWKEYP